MENIETKNNDLENTIENWNSNLENLYSKVEESEWKNKLKLYDLFLYVKNNSSQNSFVNV